MVNSEDDQWYYKTDVASYGPIPFAALRSLVETGVVPSDALVSKVPGHWQPAYLVERLVSQNTLDTLLALDQPSTSQLSEVLASAPDACDVAGSDLALDRSPVSQFSEMLALAPDADDAAGSEGTNSDSDHQRQLGYHLRSNSIESGPYTIWQLQQLVNYGRLLPEDRVRAKDSHAWIPSRQLELLEFPQAESVATVTGTNGRAAEIPDVTSATHASPTKQRESTSNSLTPLPVVQCVESHGDKASEKVADPDPFADLPITPRRSFGPVAESDLDVIAEEPESPTPIIDRGFSASSAVRVSSKSGNRRISCPESRSSALAAVPIRTILVVSGVGLAGLIGFALLTFLASSRTVLQGRVTFEGAPVTKAHVQLQSPKTGYACSAALDSAGIYHISPLLPVGEYVVCVIPDFDVPPPNSASMPIKAPDRPDIPSKYRSGASSHLTVLISKGRNSFDIDLTTGN